MATDATRSLRPRRRMLRNLLHAGLADALSLVGGSLPLVAGSLTLVPSSPAQAAWTMHAGNAQHTAVTTVPTQPLQSIHWQAPVDLQPQYSGTVLFIHYGSPLITEGNTVIFPVKVGVADTFRVEARAALDGSTKWTLDTDYLLPPHSWVPSVGLAMTPRGRLYVPAAGGTLLWTDALDEPGAHASTRVAFFGDADYAANKSAMDASLRVCTPLTSASDGTVYFGVRAVAANPLGITSGIAAVDASGSGRFVSMFDASGGLCDRVGLNCAPALSRDEQTLYIAGRGASSAPGYLVALATSDLGTRHVRALVDPLTASESFVSDNSTATPMVAPDDKVYFGVLENPFGTNAVRGWMLQFDADLVPAGVPGAFGWDHTPSLVPVSAVPSYAGPSTYLIMCKYNFYAGWGDGTNKIAILDPQTSQLDSFSGATVMKEVRTILGATPDPEAGPSFPNAVKEWCINTAVVDPFKHSVLAGAEDGKLYRWDLHTNTFSETITLTPGLGEAYTPTVAGPDGQVYAINNATLFAVGATNVGVTPVTHTSRVPRVFAEPNPSAGEATLRFVLGSEANATLDVLDLAGRRVATVWSGSRTAGEHRVRWDGRDTNGLECAPGLYVVRLDAGGRVTTARLLRLR